MTRRVTDIARCSVTRVKVESENARQNRQGNSSGTSAVPGGTPMLTARGRLHV